MAAAQRQSQSRSTLIEAMDGLWFHQIILFSNPISLLNSPITLITINPSSPPPQTTTTTPPSSYQYSLFHSSPQLSAPPPPPEEEEEEEESTHLPQSHESVVDDEEDSTDPPKNEFITEKKKSPTGRLNDMMMKSKARSFSSSSSPATKQAAKNGGRFSAVKSLPKTIHCKSLWDLELEEVKGFLDLGFKFKKQHLSRRMVTVIPGLQRILGAGGLKTNEQPCEIDDDDDDDDDEDDEDQDEERVAAGGAIMRPYLSEAWLIKRPDSPLLNLKMPKDSASADMKKHLWNWARTVAYVIQQES